MKTIFSIIMVLSFLFISCEKDKESPDEKTPETDEDATIIKAPTGLEALSYPGWIYLDWDYNYDIKQYILYWTDDGTEPSESDNKIENIEDEYYQHKELDYTKTYKYKVQSVSGENKSALSSTVSASPEIPPLEPPKNFSVTESDGNITLDWEPVNFEGIEYRLKRKCIPEDGYYKTIAENLSTAGYTDETTEVGKGYVYKVAAVDPVNSRNSEDSDPVYIATKREVFEHERNNEDTPNTLGYDTHYWDAEDITEYLDWFNVNGKYSGSYSIYSSASYRSFDADCFIIYLEDGDGVRFTLHKGNITDLWSMSVKIIEYGKNSSGNYREVLCHSFTGSTDSFTYNKSNNGTVYGCYLQISSWEDLINYGPYNYDVEIKIERKY